METTTRIPGSLKAVRVLLYIFAGISVLSSAGMFLAEEPSPLLLLAVFAFVFIPGAAAFLLAMLLPKGGTVVFCGLVLFGVGGILTSLLSVGEGPQWITQMLIPVLVLILTLTSNSREFMLRR
ncbi:hypothetical protein CLV63_13215 [Murinocardiopsis flavida]|uniref:Uncharacterized protein n=1 Tax=Murinocardiopsis flavida TaxID=645275 RepID=A0A2P8CQY3_9ACTN|nr:hypothetical protein [Murinocardiopsis flavida]PSK87360.1 hypothetical protein CLV63_13215 [Murinocardiopsis flavida]